MLDVAAQVATILATVITALSFAGLVWQAWRYMDVRKEDQQQRAFENYHQLIRDLSRGGEQIRQTSQAAIIFELRNYPQYGAVSRRILIALKQRWDSENIGVHHAEIDLTLAALEHSKE